MIIYFNDDTLAYELYSDENKCIGVYETNEQADEARRIAGGPGDSW